MCSPICAGKMSSEPKSVNKKPLLIQLGLFWCTPECDCWVHTGQNYLPRVLLDRTKLCQYKKPQICVPLFVCGKQWLDSVYNFILSYDFLMVEKQLRSH